MKRHIDTKREDTRLYWALVILSFALIPCLGCYDFFTRGEAREALVAQSMLSSNDWTLPRTYNGSVPSKPPLFHWLVSIASLPFHHVSEFTTRLPSALLALLSLSFFLFALRDKLSLKARILFLVLLSFSFEWLRASVTARVDMVHAGSLAAGLLAGFFAISESNRNRWWVVASIFIALATLGKGPVGLVIPALVLSSWILFYGTERIRDFSKLMLCLLFALASVLCWYLSAYLQSPDEFFSRFWYENVARFSGTMQDEPHKHSFLYLLAMLLVGTLPWSPFYLWQTWKNRLTFKTNWQSSPSLVKFSAIASLVIVVFYCIPSSKRGVYLLAAYPFIALIAAMAFEHLVSDRKIKQTFIAGSLLILLAQGIVIPFFVAPLTSERSLANILVQQAKDKSSIYSFGFEFYGASFYSQQRFYRLEDALASDSVTKTLKPVPGDRLIAFENDFERVEEALKVTGLTVRILGKNQIGKKNVIIAELLVI